MRTAADFLRDNGIAFGGEIISSNYNDYINTMDEYADERCIEFVDWILQNAKTTSTSREPKESIKEWMYKEDANYSMQTSEQLLETFKQQSLIK